jgi:hypothetical protein
MKKSILAAMTAIALTLVFLNSCKKDEDTEPPVIYLNGDAEMKWSVGTAYADPGATASDNEDGTVAVNIDASEVDVNKAGTYTVHLTATDKEGNSADVHRTVHVTYEGTQIDYTYSTTSVCTLSGVTDTMVFSSTVNDLASDIYAGQISNFENGLFTNPVNFTMTGSAVTIPSQTPNGAGSTITVSGTGNISKDASGHIVLDLDYTINDPGLGTITCSTTMVSP